MTFAQLITLASQIHEKPSQPKKIPNLNIDKIKK